ncbi:hypothetical protein AOQ84DRAFT_374510 [Glonium stellatum]|uniref:Uncharacterized protein n=1 Tax=Glonium stellatum TaxID=574774 RepID=A0A8E2JVP1_9PEZI|nr:hypothetical protein AOQ84DRAFT_374510 [Glonium stellatum]
MFLFEALIIALVASVVCAFPQAYPSTANSAISTTIPISTPFPRTEISVPLFSDTSASEEATLTEHLKSGVTELNTDEPRSTEHVESSVAGLTSKGVLPTEHIESSVEVTSGGFETTPYTAHIEESVTSVFPTTSLAVPIERTAITVTPPYHPVSPTGIVGVVSGSNVALTEHIEFSVTPGPQNTPEASTLIAPFAHTEIAVSEIQPTALSENSSPTTVGIGDIIGSVVAGGSSFAPQSQLTAGTISPGQSFPPSAQGLPTVTVGTQAITLTPGFTTIIGTGSATTLVALTTDLVGQSIVVIGTSSSTLSSTGTTLDSSTVSSIGANSTQSATASGSGKSQGSAAMSWRRKWGMEVWLGFLGGILGVAAAL